MTAGIHAAGLRKSAFAETAEDIADRYGTVADEQGEDLTLSPLLLHLSQRLTSSQDHAQR